MRACDLAVVLNVAFMGVAWSKLKSFGLALTHKSFDIKIKSKEELGKHHRLTRQAESLPYLDCAKLYVENELGYSEHTDYIVKKHYSSNDGVGYVYLRQVVLGKEVFNADMNVNLFTRGGRVLSVGNSFSKYKLQKEDEKVFDEAIDKIADYLNIALRESKAIYSNFDKQEFRGLVNHDQYVYTYHDETNAVSDFKGSFGWLQIENGKLEPVFSMNIQLSINEWFNAVVSIKSNILISLSDWTNKVSYRVFPITQFGSEDGERQLISDPYGRTASPLGWHNDGTTQFNYTRGNNVYVMFDVPKDSHKSQTNVEKNLDGNYDYSLDITKTDYSEYKNSSATNLLYVCNMMHDILYHYGFDEAAGNFQNHNFGTDGLANDSLEAYAQFESAKNNAYFLAPEDGMSPIMYMGIYNRAETDIDPSLENNIIIHEYGHGLANRLVGGAFNPNCLYKTESSGMSEGWSDILAILLSMNSNYDRSQEFGMYWGSANKKTGSRPSKYSVNFSTNNVAYKSLFKETDTHIIGHIWATFLYEVYWNLADKLPFTADWLGEGANNPIKYGNTYMLKLLIKSMKLMPCRPTFIDTWDSMINADLALTDGSNACEIWNAFAKQGLGLNAHFKSLDQNLDETEFDTEFDTAYSWEFFERYYPTKEYFNSYELPDSCQNGSVILS